jgi:hypothetical protein
MTDPTSYLKDLDAELKRAGLPDAHRRRIHAEFADHLECDPAADLGAPGVLATQFADELGTSYARSAALWAFLALALAGILIVVRFSALLPLGTLDASTGDTVGLLVAALAGQVALVAGGLGLVRALQLRRRPAISRQEAAVLARRAGVGLAAGAVTIVSFPFTQSYSAHPGGFSIGARPDNLFWPLASGLVLLALAAAAPAVVRASRLRPQADGWAGDLLADLGPLRPAVTRLSGGSINRLALVLGAGLVIVAALAGARVDDTYDGILRGVLESGAFLAAYAVLGRYLGIRE